MKNQNKQTRPGCLTSLADVLTFLTQATPIQLKAIRIAQSSKLSVVTNTPEG